MLRWRFLFVILALASGVSLAWGDTLTMTGSLSADAYPGSGDTVITDPSTVMYGQSFSMTLNYDPSSYTLASGGGIDTYTLTSATLSMDVGGNMFSYSSASNYLSVSFPGTYGSGSVTFLVCSSVTACSDPMGDFLNLYYTGTASGLSGMATDASTWTADFGSSPTPYQFVRNFADGSQTELDGTLNTPSGTVSGGNGGGGSPSPVPEPATLMLVATGLAGAWMRRRRTAR